MLLTYWNTVAFQTLYARHGRLGAGDAGTRRRPTARCWTGGLLSRAAPAGRATSTRRSRPSTPSAPARCSRRSSTTCPTGTCAARRRRFWDGDPAALATLHECLDVVTLLMAPLTPFITERVWQDLVRAGRRRTLPESVHLAAWPRVDAALVDADAGRRRWRWSAGWSSSAGRPGPRPKVQTRQPLRRALVGAPGCDDAADGAARARSPTSSTSRRSSRCPRPAATWSTSPRRPTSARWASGSASRRQAVAAAIAAADAGRARRRAARRRARRRVAVDGEPVELLRRRGDRHRDARARAGRWPPSRARPSRSTWSSPRSCGGPGWPARSVRLVQEARKTSGLDVTDRIALRWSAPTASWPRRCASTRPRSPARCWRRRSPRAAWVRAVRRDDELGLAFALRQGAERRADRRSGRTSAGAGRPGPATTQPLNSCLTLVGRPFEGTIGCAALLRPSCWARSRDTG